jgi:hypothetical protein
MGTEVTLFEGGAALPAHLNDLNADKNIVGRDQVPSLSFRGKVWRVVLDSKEEIVLNTDQEPAQSVPVVILDYNKKRSRAYYEGAYEEGKNKAPTCWSKDGELPDESVENKQSTTCASCKWAVKGSRTSDTGAKLTACSQFKRMVIVPATNVKHPILLVKIPQTSMWDKDNKDNEAKNFFAFDQYMDFLRARGINHTATVITKIKFDSRMAYPKLIFGPMGYLPQELVEDVRVHLNNKEAIDKLLNTMSDMAGGERGAAPVPEEYKQPEAATVQTQEAQPAQTTAPAPAATPAAPAAPKPTPRPRPAKPAAPAAAAPAAIPPVAEEPVPVSTAKPSANPGLAEMMKNWDD